MTYFKFFKVEKCLNSSSLFLIFKLKYAKLTFFNSTTTIIKFINCFKKMFTLYISYNIIFFLTVTNYLVTNKTRVSSHFL